MAEAAPSAAVLSIHSLETHGIPSGATCVSSAGLLQGPRCHLPLDSRIATLGFGYNLALRMDEPDRLENPLGFQVTSYRVDADFAPVPPAESEPEVFSSAPSAEEPVNPLPVMGDGPAVSAQAEGAP